MTQVHNFRLRAGAGCLTFGPEVLRLFESSMQKGWGRNESVGQLYARNLTADDVRVEVATLLPPVSASRSGVRFNPCHAFDERAKLFKKGLHCVGLWHTHPEPIPVPSMEDELLAADYACAAAQELLGIVFVIVGTKPFPHGLGVWIHDQRALRKLQADAQV